MSSNNRIEVHFLSLISTNGGGGGVFHPMFFFPINCFVLEPIFSKIGDISNIQIVRNKKSKLASHRYLIEFYEINQMSHISHLYDIIINTRITFFLKLQFKV